MNVKILPFYLVLIALFPALCMGEEYELHSWNMREVSPMEVTEATGPESVDIYYENSERCCEVCSGSHDNPYIIYRFGISRIVTVKVEKNEDGYDIFLCGEKDGQRCIKIINGRIPILEWAFKDMPLELENVEYETSDIYSDVYHQLSIVGDNIETTVCSPYLEIVGNEYFIEKIDDLKKYIIEIWAEETLH